MNLTPYHAKYFAFELTKRCSSDSLQKLTSSLSDVRADSIIEGTLARQNEGLVWGIEMILRMGGAV